MPKLPHVTDYVIIAPPAIMEPGIDAPPPAVGIPKWNSVPSTACGDETDRKATQAEQRVQSTAAVIVPAVPAARVLIGIAVHPPNEDDQR